MHQSWYLCICCLLIYVVYVYINAIIMLESPIFVPHESIPLHGHNLVVVHLVYLKKYLVWISVAVGRPSFPHLLSPGKSQNNISCCSLSSERLSRYMCKVRMLVTVIVAVSRYLRSVLFYFLHCSLIQIFTLLGAWPLFSAFFAFNV
jgi:hypothetical protein